MLCVKTSRSKTRGNGFFSLVVFKNVSTSVFHRTGRLTSFTFLSLRTLFVLMVMILPTTVWAQDLSYQITRASVPQTLTIEVGKSIVLRSPIRIKRASLGNPEVASTIVLSPTQLYLYGKTMGSTNMTFWGRDGKVFAVYDLIVQPNLTQLKAQIHELFPEEKGIKIGAAQDHITLAGSASGPDVIAQVLGVANAYAPKKVMNMLQVEGVQQVMLEVKVAEMSKGLLRRLGVNFIHQNGTGTQIGLLDNLTNFERNDNGSLVHLLGITSNLAFAAALGNGVLTVVLSALKEHNLTKILAEPTLTTVSGQEASFLAGGEFPIPVPQAFGVTTIVFKEFGVSLNFNPTVLSDGRISMKLAPEVSELDFANGLNSQGFTIPAILTRRVETVIELRDGQSFAIAGLMQDNIRESIAKYPFLGDIPILGTLFRSTDFQKNETELIIIVTPHLVKPLDMQKQTLPTDAYLEPNDFEFMLMGYMEGVRSSGGDESITSRDVSSRGPTEPSSTLQTMSVGGGLEGQFGHLAP